MSDLSKLFPSQIEAFEKEINVLRENTNLTFSETVELLNHYELQMISNSIGNIWEKINKIEAKIN